MSNPLPFTDDECAKCRSCSTPVVWALTAVARKPIPIDPDPREDGNLVLERVYGRLIAYPITLFDGDVPTYVSHFATCPNATDHRKDRPT